MMTSDKLRVEDIREAVYEVTVLPFEFPRHLLEPVFNLVNQKCEAAIYYQDIYSLEILLDTLALMDARNFQAEQEYQKLSITAHGVANNLIKAINMEIHDDNEMLKVLVENIAIAKKIGMRGEVIDIAVTFKALCTKFLQEMLQNRNEEEDQDQNEVYMLKEDDLSRSVTDPKYNKYSEQTSLEVLGITSDYEPHLAYHPFITDYIKLVGLNINYTKKNQALARKQLFDEESYGMINVYTRSSFLLTDGLPDMAKNLHYSNIRDDFMLRLARLLFRYRLNLDNLFPKKVFARFNSEAFEAELKDKGFIYHGIQKGQKVEDYSEL